MKLSRIIVTGLVLKLVKFYKFMNHKSLDYCISLIKILNEKSIRYTLQPTTNGYSIHFYYYQQVIR